jgi:formylglycine-generating enzyme required for sulfatase activity
MAERNPHASWCCSPSSDAAPRTVEAAIAPLAREPAGDDMVRLDGGAFWMGTDSGEGFPADGEGPAHEVALRPFWIDRTAVSNAEFGAFAATTRYRTDAERIGWSFVFYMLLPEDFPPQRTIACAPWWRQVDGATWREPEGPGSSVGTRMDHPVVHVSWNDAVAYARWANKRLPSEAEWEYAARGGLVKARYPWGNELVPGGVHCCNIWQGTFPTENTRDDGFVGTAPVASYEPNGFGLYNMAGNVWEWCADWFSPTYYTDCPPCDPMGPARGKARVIRGGSYLCHESYCNRYRVAARSHNTSESSTGHMGFRCARDAT